jgi:predicted dehydrogenase
MKQIAWGIIGCGNVTENKSGPAFQRVPNASLAAVMRRDAAKAADYASRHGVPKWYNRAEDLIADAEVNAVYIATPPAYHEVYALAALKAGKPVYVEKPFATTLSECSNMEATANQYNLPLCVAHYRRALPKFLAIKEMLAEKLIGDICTVQIRMQQPDQSAALAASGESNWRVVPTISGGGIFFDLAPHQLDLLVYFFGPALSFKGMAHNRAGLYEAEDVVTGMAQLSNGILFSGQWCFTSAAVCREDVFEITGTAGRIVFPTFGHEVLIRTKDGEKKLEFDPPQHIQQPMIEKVTRYFLGEGPNPCSASEAIHSFKMMAAFTGKQEVRN